MCVVLQIYGIGRAVYDALDELCAHFSASEHFDRSVRGRLNNVLMGRNLSGEFLPYCGQRTG